MFRLKGEAHQVTNWVVMLQLRYQYLKSIARRVSDRGKIPWETLTSGFLLTSFLSAIHALPMAARSPHFFQSTSLPFSGLLPPGVVGALELVASSVLISPKATGLGRLCWDDLLEGLTSRPAAMRLDMTSIANSASVGTSWKAGGILSCLEYLKTHSVNARTYLALSSEGKAARIGMICQKNAPPRKYTSFAMYCAGSNRVRMQQKQRA